MPRCASNSELREADALKRITQPHLLVIDEVGRQFGTDAEKTQIEESLGMRCQEELPNAKMAESWPYAIGRGTWERKRTDHLYAKLISGSLTRR